METSRVEHGPETETEQMNIKEIKQANADAGFHFFAPDTMRFFDSRVHEEVHEGPGGIYIVTSEKPPHNPRRYTFRSFDPDTGAVSSTNETFLTAAKAHRAAEEAAQEPGEADEEPAVLKGLVASVFRDAGVTDCTNGGVTARATKVTLIGPGVPEIFPASEDAPALLLEDRSPQYGPRAIPLTRPEGHVGPMFGGNFIYTSDSRFPSDAPIPVHDRFETPEVHATLSR